GPLFDPNTLPSKQTYGGAIHVATTAMPNEMHWQFGESFEESAICGRLEQGFRDGAANLIGLARKEHRRKVSPVHLHNNLHLVSVVPWTRPLYLPESGGSQSMFLELVLGNICSLAIGINASRYRVSHQVLPKWGPVQIA